jgi:hypothetical protein
MGFLLMGLLFIGIWPYPAVILLGFPIFVAMFIGILWDGFYRTPNAIHITGNDLEFRFRTRETRLVSWQDVEKVEIPSADPTTLHGKYLAISRVYIKGEKRPYDLSIDAGRTILAAYHERRQ